jgi:hypothetical protein
MGNDHLYIRSLWHRKLTQSLGTSKNKKVFHEFVDAINRHDPELFDALMSIFS